MTRTEGLDTILEERREGGEQPAVAPGMIDLPTSTSGMPQLYQDTMIQMPDFDQTLVPEPAAERAASPQPATDATTRTTEPGVVVRRRFGGPRRHRGLIIDANTKTSSVDIVARARDELVSTSHTRAEVRAALITSQFDGMFVDLMHQPRHKFARQFEQIESARDMKLYPDMGIRKLVLKSSRETTHRGSYLVPNARTLQEVIIYFILFFHKNPFKYLNL